MRPAITPSLIKSGSRVSTPGMPFGMRSNEASSPATRLPSLPCMLNGAWSDEKIVNSPLDRPFQMNCWLPLSRGGGLQMQRAPCIGSSGSIPRSSALRNRYCGQVSAWIGSPRPRAQWICSTASRPETWTIRIGVSISSASAIARWVASRSTAIGRELRVVARRRQAGIEQLLGQPGDAVAVLGVDHGHRAVLARHRQHLDDLPVGQLQVVVGHVDLEGGVALLDQGRQLALRHVLGGIGDDQVEGVVDHRLAFGAAVVVVDRLLDAVALLLRRERQHGGGAAAGRRAGAGEEVVGKARAVAGRLVEMAVAVDAAGRDQPAARHRSRARRCRRAAARWRRCGRRARRCRRGSGRPRSRCRRCEGSGRRCSWRGSG